MYEGEKEMAENRNTNQKEEYGWPYEEVDAYVRRYHDRMLEAEETGNFGLAQEQSFTDDAIYNWNIGPTEPDMIANGKDEVLRIAYGAELAGVEGWKYPMVDYWLDPQQGLIVWKFEMISPWPKWPDGDDYYMARGHGYTMQIYVGDMHVNRQYDECETPPLYWTHAEGIALGAAGKTLTEKYHMRVKRIQSALARREEYLEDLREEYADK
jgi:hypothetical protein